MARPLPLGRCLLLAVIATTTHVAIGRHHRGPIIDLHGAEQLTAIIEEDDNVLTTVPDIGIVPDSGPVCAYEITTNGDESPQHVFTAHVVDKHRGEAIIRVQDAAIIDCNKQKEYDLQIIAIRCNDEETDEATLRSEPVRLRVTVKDTNNHAPVFSAPWFTFTVEEGIVPERIGSVVATDDDCGHPFGQICEYTITNALNSLPFTIDNKGVIRNTRPLNASTAGSYILTIVASDCGMRKSKSALITVHVKETCVATGHRGLPDSIAYEIGKPVLPMAGVSTALCQESCTVDEVESTVTLTDGSDEVCTKEAVYGDEHTLKRCHFNEKTVNLLSPPANGEATTNHVTEQHDFDGTKAVPVDPRVITELVPDAFALHFTMRHEKGTKEEQNRKHNILCESDHYNMNRHHFAVYIRHCKLEVVLRREAGSTPEFRAAEWRWARHEVCDGEWHSYSLLFSGVDNVTLIVDGKTTAESERSPEILDDWPLHKAGSVATRLVVGACWHGRQQQFVQHVRAHIGTMQLLLGHAETRDAVECAHECSESIEYDGEEAVRGTHTQLTMTTKSIAANEQMLRRVVYRNNATTGMNRTLKVKTTVKCHGQEKIIELPVASVHISEKPVVVSPPVSHGRLLMSVSAPVLIQTTAHAVRIGTPMLPEIKLTIVESEEGVTREVTDDYKLQQCTVHLRPSRDMDLEYFSSPSSLIAASNIEFEHDKQGITLSGLESTANYRNVLAKIHYFNTRPDAYSRRLYAVKCTMQDKQKNVIESNELLLTMHIDPADSSSSSSASPSSSSPAPSLLATDSDPLDSLDLIGRQFEPTLDQIGASRLQNILEMDLPRPKALLSHHGAGYDVGQGAIAGGAVALVVVVCVGFLLVLLVVGVLKMRDAPMTAHRRRRQQKKAKHARAGEQTGMQWDDAGMNIIINPLEDVKETGVAVEQGMCEYTDEEDSEESDSEYSYRDEEEEEEDDEAQEVLPHVEDESGQRNGLEWDDEACLSPRHHSYRV